MPLYRYAERQRPRAAGAAGEPDQRRHATPPTTSTSRSSSSSRRAPRAMLHALQISTEINLQLGEILLAALRQGRPQHRRRGWLRAADLRSRARRSATCTRRSAAPATTTSSPTASTAPPPTLRRAQPRPTSWPGSRYDRAGMIELYLRPDRALRHRHHRGPAARGRLRGLRRADRAPAASRSSATTCSSPTRSASAAGIEAGAANSLLWKVNQIGTLSEALDAAEMAFRSGYTRGRVGALGRDRGPDHRRPGGGAERRPDQDRRAGARRAHRQVQPAAADRRGAGDDRPSTRRRRRRRPVPVG